MAFQARGKGGKDGKGKGGKKGGGKGKGEYDRPRSQGDDWPTLGRKDDSPHERQEDCDGGACGDDSREAQRSWRDGGDWGGGKGRGGGYRGGSRYGDRNRFGNVFEDDAEQATLFRSTRHNAGINFDKYDDIPVEITGGEKPPPLADFATCEGLHKSLLANIERSGYRKPTPVQKWAVPILLQGKDLMSCAQTGSGKTAAFLLPMINTCLTSDLPLPEQTQRYFVAHPTALILAPTRELAIQIYDESRKFCYRTGLRTVVAYGGAEIRAQQLDLERGCQVVVATPGRLSDFLQRKKLRLSHLRYLCLDEADRMLDMGFEIQIRDIVEKSDMPPISRRQTLMFSATFPEQIQRLAQDFMGNYLFITVGRIGSTTDSITQRLEFCPAENKDEMLISILRSQDAKKLTLVFVETKRTADALERRLCESNIGATSIHGDRAQSEREEALQKFKSGETPVLVATDVASRGLDIPNVGHVIQYDLPRTIDDYTHRIGRTGRAGNIGVATSFFNERGGGINRDVLEYLRSHKQDVPERLAQIVSRAADARGSRQGKGGGARPFSSVDVRKDAKAPQGNGAAKARGAKLAPPPAEPPSSGMSMMSMMGMGGGRY